MPYLDGGRTPAGWDCYGLVYYVSRHLFGRLVPAYQDYGSAIDREAVARSLGRHICEWQPVPRETIEPGDVLVLRVWGVPMHCGLALGGGTMLHCLAGHETVRESYTAPQWASRFEGAYRWS